MWGGLSGDHGWSESEHDTGVNQHEEIRLKSILKLRFLKNKHISVTKAMSMEKRMSEIYTV